jgi:hypothetical protein
MMERVRVPFANVMQGALTRVRCFPFRKRHPLHRCEAYRPFFIITSGRSGSTLLRRILQASPQLHIPPETYVLGKAICFYRDHRYLPWDYLVHFVLCLFEYDPEFDCFELSLRPLVKRLLEVPVESRSLALVFDAFYRYHAECSGQAVERWGDKTPLNAFVLPEILSVFPDAQFVHVLRDGVDVVHSMVEVGLAPTLRHAALRWRKAVRVIRAFVRANPASCVEIRYEYLVSDPHSIVARVCAFLDVDFSESMLDSTEHAATMSDLAKYRHYSTVLTPISTARIGNGRRAFSVAEKLQLQELIGADLVQLGYDPLA